MKKQFLYFSFFSLLLIEVSSCGKSLDKNEKSVIENDLAEIVYKENLWYVAGGIDDYFYEAVEAYADKGHEEMQAKIDNYSATSSLFGGGWDLAELFGSSTPEIYRRTYYRYINYANDNRKNMAYVINEVTEIVENNPDILDKFEEEANFSLLPFRNIEGLSSEYVSAKELSKYKNLSFSNANKEEWGELIMGPLKNPHFSSVAVVCGTLKALSFVDFPEAVYALYDEKEKAWEVGYDSEDAYLVNFVKKGDILEFQYSPTEYYEGYIESKTNKLK